MTLTVVKAVNFLVCCVLCYPQFTI